MSAEERLAQDLRSKDPRVLREAERELVLVYEARIRAILSRIVEPSLLDDAIQEVFADVLRGRKGFVARSRLSTWIYRVALRRGWKIQARAARRRKAEKSLEAETTEYGRTPRGDSLETRELAERLEAALGQLDFDQRSVLALSACEDLGPAKIAETLGIPVGTVHSRLSRARARLRTLLDISE